MSIRVNMHRQSGYRGWTVYVGYDIGRDGREYAARAERSNHVLESGRFSGRGAKQKALNALRDRIDAVEGRTA